MRRLSSGKEPIAENAALVAQLGEWGVTANKDLVLDTSGVGQIFGLSEVVPLVSTYETHPIVLRMKGVATAFPLSRTLDVKTGGKVDGIEAVLVVRQQLRNHESEFSRDPDQSSEGQERSAEPGASASSGGQSRIVVVRLVQLGREQLYRLQWQPRPVPEHGQLAVVGRRADLDSAEGSGRPASRR